LVYKTITEEVEEGSIKRLLVIRKTKDPTTNNIQI
jgi:hypothetical protein